MRPNLLMALMAVIGLTLLASPAYAQQSTESTLTTNGIESASYNPASFSIATETTIWPKLVVLVDPSLVMPWGANQVVFRTTVSLLDGLHIPVLNPRFQQAMHWEGYNLAKKSTARDAASTIALKAGAALAVVLRCKAVEVGFEGDLLAPYTCRATVSGNVLVAATGRPVKSQIVVHHKASGADESLAESTAIASAATIFADEALKRIKFWSYQREERGNAILVRFRGMDSYARIIDIRNVLYEIPRCTNVTQKSVSLGDPNKPNFAEISLSYLGTARVLYGEIAAALADEIAPLRLSPISISSHLMELELWEPEKTPDVDSAIEEPSPAAP